MSAPFPGQKWQIPTLVNKLGSLSTLIGTIGPEQGTPSTPTMSAHLYRLAGSEPDQQGPHAQEELYYVLSGSRTLVLTGGSADENRVPVSPGDLVYVPAHSAHHFEGNEEITFLVFFAPNFGGVA